MNHQNIILIITDDLGFGDLSCYGSELNKTPHLDQMAKEGIRATQFNTAQAVCSASRAAFLTGLYPNRIGIHNALMPKAKIGLNPNEITIAEWLQQEGYQTALYGKWHLGDRKEVLPLNHGFDEYYGIPYSNDMWPFHPQQGTVFNFGPLPLIEGDEIIDTIIDQSLLTQKLTQKTIQFIEENKSNPFFIYLAHPQPHVPLFVSEKFKGKSNNGLYGDVIMELDWSVGEILSKLRKLDIDKNTLVIFTSDNGPWLSYGNHAGNSGILREGKGTAWEGGHRVPFIAWQPGFIPEGGIIQDAIYAIDVFPTIAHWVNPAKSTPQFDGQNISKILTLDNQAEMERTFNYYYKTNELHAIRYGDWKLVFPHNYRSMQGQEQGKDGLPGAYKYIDIEKAELYNLRLDPEEKINVYKDNLDVVAKMENYALKTRTELGDNLLNEEGNAKRQPFIFSD